MLSPAVNAPAQSLQAPSPGRPRVRPQLEPHLESRLWQASSLSRSADPAWPSGFAALDAELPGGGWPRRAVTELLTAQPGVLEWRLLAPGLKGWWDAQALPPAAPGRRRQAAAPGMRSLLLINPPHTPHLPGLQALGLPPAALIWVSATTPAQQLWATEEAIRAGIAVLAWLPEARPEQIRRLQVSALASDAPAFLVRPEHAGRQSSAAPLRLVVQPGEVWQLAVHLLKRRGPAHEGWLTLPAVPGAVEPLLTAARRKPLPAPAPQPEPVPEPAPVSPPTERPHALARPVLHA